MPGIVLAWLAGESIIVYRSFKDAHRPPMPGQLLASTGLFAALGLIAKSDQGKFLANAMAWGFVIAAFYNLAPQLTGQIPPPPGSTGTTSSKQPATAPATGGRQPWQGGKTP